MDTQLIKDGFNINKIKNYANEFLFIVLDLANKQGRIKWKTIQLIISLYFLKYVMNF